MIDKLEDEADEGRDDYKPHVTLGRLYYVTIGVSVFVCVRNSCKAAGQLGHHAASSYRRIRSPVEPIPAHDNFSSCSILEQAGNALTCYIQCSLTQFSW